MNPRLLRLMLGTLVGVGAAGLWLALLAPPRASLAAPAGQTFIVNSAADVPDDLPGDGKCQTAPVGGFCTLRAAVQEADALAGADTIQLQANTTYVLAQPSGNPSFDGNLDISETVTLLGAGPDSTLIDGNGSVLGERVFDIITGTVVISGVTIQNGDATNFGGGILNDGALTLINSAILSNTVNGVNDWGGGIATFGPLTVTHSLIRNNQTGKHNAYGGGIADNGLSALYIFDSIISDNSTTGTLGYGGGVYGYGRILNSTISGNSATNGGGIYQPGGGLVVINSTVMGNSARAGGGGLFSNFGPVKLFNVTVDDNLSNSDEVGTGLGGGVAVGGGTFDFTNSIIAGNNKVVVPGPSLIPDDCYGSLTSGGFNLLSAVDTDYCTVSNYTLADPLLGPLQDNGGPTPTQALLPGSPAVDAGNPSGCTDDVGAPLTTDQRGRPRPVFGGAAMHCDIGAFEAAPDFSGSSKTVNATTVRPGDLLTYTLTISNRSPLTANFTLTDALDAHLSLVSAPGLSGSTTLTATGLLSGSAQVSYKVAVRMGQNSHGVVANIAQLAGDGFVRQLTARLVSAGQQLWLPLTRR